MLSYYLALLAKKQEEVRRLNVCNSSLSGKKAEFQSNQHKCLEPHLTTTTWHGTLADSFDDIREGGIEASYLEIVGSQFSAAFSAIANKIASLEAEIEQIKRIIEEIRAREAAEAAARAKAAK